jgi:uncharacterized protein (TIGR03643 family)
MARPKPDERLDARATDRVIQMAWEDRTPFDAIEWQFGLDEEAVIRLMRRHLKASSFRLWRKRVQGRSTKHLRKRPYRMGRFRAAAQKDIGRS